MRTVSAGLFHSLDGVVEAPDQWQFDAYDEEVDATLGQVISTIDTALLGRVGYQQWAGYWPSADTANPFTGFINGIPKHVASRTLTGDLEWENATVIDGDLETFVTELKNTDGGEIGVMGGISLVRQLWFAGLLDKLTLVTHPVIAGQGRHLFEPGDPVTRLTLESSQTTGAGNIISTYRVS